MRRAGFFGMCVVFLLIPLASTQEQPTLQRRLSNQDIVGMVQLGLSEDVIIAKIRSVNASDPAQTRFDTSMDGLKALKSANVPDAVIRVMINPGPAEPTLVAAGSPVTLDPNLPPPEVGVYWKDESRFVLIEGQALSQTKIGGKAGSMFTYGFRGLHWDAYINGATSNNQVKERRPVFYIYVPDGISANDYSLMKLNKKGDRREFQVGNISGRMGLGGKAGVNHDKEISFQAEHVGIRTYKISLSQDLKPGEYAFFMATGEQVGSSQGRGTGGVVTGRIYDFRVPE